MKNNVCVFKKECFMRSLQSRTRWKYFFFIQIYWLIDNSQLLIQRNALTKVMAREVNENSFKYLHHILGSGVWWWYNIFRIIYLSKSGLWKQRNIKKVMRIKYAGPACAVLMQRRFREDCIDKPRQNTGKSNKFLQK